MKYLCLLFALFTATYCNVLAENGQDELKDVAVQINKSVINLRWKLVSPAETYKFVISRKKSGENNFEQIAQVMTRDNVSKSGEGDKTEYLYEYRDKLKENGVYVYNIQAFDLNKKLLSENQIKVGVSEIPEFKLKQNSPNPFNPTTSISYELFKPGSVKLTVYDLSGKVIEVLKDGYQTAGSYTVSFDASKHSEISSGIYFYKLQTEYFTDIKKMIFTK